MRSFEMASIAGRGLRADADTTAKDYRLVSQPKNPGAGRGFARRPIWLSRFTDGALLSAGASSDWPFHAGVGALRRSAPARTPAR